MKIADLKKLIYLNYEPRLIAGFRRAALATENEVLAYLLGKVWTTKGVSYARIEKLYWPELIVSTPFEVWPAEGSPEGFIGSIHSHPQSTWMGGESQADHHGAILDGEKVYGIYSYNKPKEGRTQSRTEWWAPGRIVVMN